MVLLTIYAPLIFPTSPFFNQPWLFLAVALPPPPVMPPPVPLATKTSVTLAPLLSIVTTLFCKTAVLFSAAITPFTFTKFTTPVIFTLLPSAPPFSTAAPATLPTIIGVPLIFTSLLFA